MDKLVEFALKNTSTCLIIIAVACLAIFGLIKLLTAIYDLFFKIRKNYIAELRDHLGFKDQCLKDYMDHITELKEQLDLQTAQRQMNFEIIEDLNCENERLKSILSNGLMTCMWMLERERFFRRVLVKLSIGSVTSNTYEFFQRNFDLLAQLIHANDELYDGIPSQQGEFTIENVALYLSGHYTQLSIKREIEFFSKIADELASLPKHQKMVAAANEASES